MMRREVEKDPTNSRLWGYQGLIYRTIGKFDQALECVEKALQIAPLSSHAHFCFAQVKRATGENELALRHYLMASQICPDDPLLLNLVGVMQMTEGMLQEAKMTLHRALELAPCLTHIKVNLGLIAFFDKNDDLASFYFKEVYKENPSFFYFDPNSLKEWDPFRQFYFDTVPNYSGLSFYYSYIQQKSGTLNEV